MRFVLTLLLIVVLLPISAFAQDDKSRPPAKGGVVKSMGQPMVYLPYGAITAGVYLDGDTDEAVGYGTLGLYKDLMNPVASLIGWAIEGYAGPRGSELDGGFRAYLSSPFLFFGGGADFNLTDQEWDFILTFNHHLRRGGIFGNGTSLRVDWIPGRGNSFDIGVQIPIGQPYAGKTRPRHDHVKLSGPIPKPVPLDTEEPALGEALANVRESARWVGQMNAVYFDQKNTEEFSQYLEGIEVHIGSTDSNFPNGHTNEAEVRFYHQELDRAFSVAVSGDPLKTGESTPLGRAVAADARAALLEEIIIPYNSLLGQKKKKDTVLEFGVSARGSFIHKMHSENEVPDDRVKVVRHTFQALVDIIEENRKLARDQWGDSRVVWLPYQYALLPEQHDTQAEIDEVIGKAVGHPFTEGNRLWYVMNEKWQWEVAKHITEAEDYHVFWIHDIRGVTAEGNPDHVTYAQIVNTYIGTMTERVREYDTTGKLPVYIIIFDAWYYVLNESRAWVNVLEDPMNATIKLPEDYAWMNEGLAKAQAELRDAVANSKLLQAEAAEYGEAWLENRIKVHVSNTNPADVTFRSRGMLPLFGAPDALMRDHRKISFYDISEDDPYKGMVIYSGMGIGEHYVGPTWEDRGLLAMGPALLNLKTAARNVLLDQGFKSEEIPYPLRPKRLAPDYYEKIKRRVENAGPYGGYNRALEAHNHTGFGPKRTSVLKASLYNLMPPGTTIIMPDPVWQNPLWAGLVLGAALRGAVVIPISPSLKNAPSNDPVTMSRTHMVFSRLIIAENMLRGDIEAAGGLLRVGLYNPDVDVADILGRVQAWSKQVNAHPFLKGFLNFDHSVYAMVDQADSLLASQGFEEEYVFDTPEIRAPTIHLKVQFFASREAWADLMARPEWPEIIKESARQRAIQIKNAKTYVDVRDYAEAMRALVVPMVTEYLGELTPEEQEKAFMYLTVGSQNQDFRGMLMDGEVLYCVSGWGAMNGLLDFVMLMGLSEWPKTQEELDELIPPPTGMQSGIARWFKFGL